MASEKVLTAIERAKLVAAKLTQQMPQKDTPTKRPNESIDEGSSKKFASISDVIGSQLATLKAQSGSTISEEMKVPDRYVGLVIGKGGEQMARIQAETGCKLQIPTDTRGMDRIISLIGTKESIEQAKKLIDEIVRRGMQNAGDPRGGIEVFEMRIPSAKCGLIIGKAGETIKRLSEQYGVKLVVVQETNGPGGGSQSGDKPLRITGEPDKVQRAKEAVLDMLQPKPEPRYGGSDSRGGSSSGGSTGGSGKYSTNEYGSKLNGSSYGNSSGGGGMGGGGGLGGRDRDKNIGGHSNDANTESFIRVPSEKAGVVIGKGGESIKDIKTKSGAHVEIDRNNRDVDHSEKMFVIRGTFDQIMYAQQLIYEKVTGVIGAQVPPGYFGSQALQPPSGYNMNSTNPQQYVQNWPNTAATGNYQQQQPSSNWTEQPNKPQSPNNSQNLDAAWAAYYSYYGMTQQAQAQSSQQTTPAQNQTGQIGANNFNPQSQQQTQQQQQQTPNSNVQPTINPQTGQPDYSQAWIEYYRSLGMYAEADAILKQTANTNTTSANTQNQPAPNQQQVSAQNWQNYAAQYASYHGYQQQGQ